MLAIWGANGFIGSHLTDFLRKNEIKSKLFARNFDHYSHKGVSSLQAYEYDFSRPKDYMMHLMDCQTLVLLVTASYVRNFEGSPEQEIAMNVDPYKKFIDAIPADSNIKKIIYLSSGGAIYGNVSEGTPISESNTTNPISIYGKSKLEVEEYIKKSAISGKWDYTILRLSNPVGRDKKCRGLVNTVLNASKENVPVTVYGDGLSVRDYFDVDELGQCIMLSSIREKAKNKTYNVGSGVGYTVMDVIEIAQKVTNKKLNIEYRDSNPADVKYNVLDCTKINSDLNWHTINNLEDTMLKMWNNQKV